MQDVQMQNTKMPNMKLWFMRHENDVVVKLDYAEC